MGTFYEDLALNSKELTDEELGFKDRKKLKGEFATLFFASVVYLVLVAVSLFIDIALLTIAQGICYIVTGVTLIKIGYSEGRDVKLYYVAGIAQIIGGTVVCIQSWIDIYFLAKYVSLGGALLIYCLGLVFFYFGAVCEYKAYARTVELVDGTMAEKWKTYTTMYLISTIGLFFLLLLNIFCSSGFLVILLVGFVIFCIVVMVLKSVYLSKTTDYL